MTTIDQAKWRNYISNACKYTKLNKSFLFCLDKKNLKGKTKMNLVLDQPK